MPTQKLAASAAARISRSRQTVRRDGHARSVQLAGAAVVAGARAHHPGLEKAGQEELPFQLEGRVVELARHGVGVLAPAVGATPEKHGSPEAVDQAAGVRGLRRIGRAGAVAAVVVAAVQALHAHPLGGHDPAGVDDGRGVGAATIIDTSRIVTAEWVRMKCLYGCDDNGSYRTCPPNSPEPAYTRRLVDGFRRAVLLRG